MSWFSDFFNPGGGYKSAQEQLDKYYQQAQGNLDPYNQHGQETYGKYSGAMDKLLNPAALEDEWNKNYKESDYAKQNEAMAQQHGLGAASSMGLLGSSPALQAIQSGTARIGAQDRQQYLDDLMKKYMAGIGIGKDIYGQGENAANSMSQNAMHMGENSAQNQFNQKNAGGDMFGKLLGLGGSFLGGFLPGGIGKGFQNMGNNNNNSWNTGGR